MRFSKSDLPLMRWSIAAICTSVLLSSLILYSSSRYADYKKTNLRTAQSQLKDARGRLTAAREDKENLSAYSAEYGVLEEQNIIGDDHRLDWMEGLEKLRQQNLALDFRYNISPQKNYVPQPAIDSGNFNIHYSEMKLQFDLLHEGQLLIFFDALRRQIKGQYQLEGCTLKRTNIAENADGTTSHSTRLPKDGSQVAGYATPMTTPIKAECSGGWITLKNRNAPQ